MIQCGEGALVLGDLAVDECDCFFSIGCELFGFADFGVEFAEALGEFAHAFGDGLYPAIIGLDACDEGRVLALDGCDDGAGLVDLLTMLVELTRGVFALIAGMLECFFGGRECFL